jgi:hypothetical protein
MRWVPVVVVGLASLACGGEQFAKMAFDADIQQGTAASLPAGFPLSTPAGTTLEVVMAADLLGQSTTTAVFVVGEGADVAAILEAAAVEAEGAGFTVDRQPESVTGAKDGEHVVIGKGDVEGKPSVSIIWTRPGA